MQQFTGGVIPQKTSTGPSRESRLETLLNGQVEVLEMISRGDSLRSIMDVITRLVERQSEGELYASILLLDEEGKHLLHGSAPSLPEAYNQAIHGLPIGEGVGSCGTAVFRKQPVMVRDIATDPLWADYRDLALSFGLKSCWSTPLVKKDGSVLGTFALYFSESREPNQEDFQLIKLVTRTIELAIEMKLSEEERTRLLISERKQFEKVDLEHQHLYKLLMDAPAVIAVLRGPDHVYELANPKYLQVVAGPRNILGKPIREALPELQGQGVYELLDDVYQKGIPYINNEFLVKLDRTGNGLLEDIYFNFIFQPIKTMDKTEGIFIHAVDVTELVSARKLAEESEERFRSLVLHSPSPIGIYIGREMRLQTVNDAILEAWGKDNSVIGKTFREALPELEGQPFYELLDKVYTTGIPYQATEDRVDLIRNGRLEVTYWNFTYKALRNADGRIYGVINTGTEVTDLVLARHKLSMIREELKTAVDIAELGTWHYDAHNQLITCSERMVEWFGLNNRVATVNEFLASIDSSDREQAWENYRKAILKKSGYEDSYQVINRTTGIRRFIHARGKASLDDNGNIIYLSGTARDVTVQKINEQELEKEVEARTIALQKAIIDLNNVNQNLKQFAYVASHDLQEPLRKINMFTDILQKKNKDQLPESSQVLLDKITQSAMRMTNLISDLLEFSRIDAWEHLLVETNLNTILENIRVDFEMLIDEKNATLDIGHLGLIEAVPLQMNQLFYNLVGNALKFTRPGVPPLIRISSRILAREEVLAYHQLNARWAHCEIIVSDNGIGFDQNFSTQIFTIFQRLHGRSEFEGTGIGLALCKKIVENHDGEIFAHAKEGAGSSFHVILPVRRKE